MMSGYKLYTLEKIAQHKTWWKFQWPILLPGVKDLIEQESMKALKGSRPLFSYCCKMLWKTLKGTGVLLKNYRQIYKFKRKSINLVNVIIFILMLRIWWVWSREIITLSSPALLGLSSRLWRWRSLCAPVPPCSAGPLCGMLTICWCVPTILSLVCQKFQELKQ